jgi:S-(hydroxymethyl)glutathione dehydrogenase / alcohol dehydrogenase
VKAVVFHKPKDVRVENVPDPRIEDSRDAIIRVTSTAICGSDLHIYNGLVPQPRPMVLGHEFMGIVEEVGAGVNNLRKGDRVIVPFPIACGQCWFCSRGWPTQCERSNPDKYGPEGGLLDQKGGALFGYTDIYGGYNGGDAEAVRVPYADYGPRKVPEKLTDEQVLFLTDILVTGWSAIDWVNLQGGETVAVFGCGPVGLMAQKIAWVRGAGRVIGLDIQPYRLETARHTANAETINVKDEDPAEAIRAMTEGRGADVCVDAVGMEVDQTLLEKVADVLHVQAGSIKALKMAISSVRRGGRISVVGVYATGYDDFPLGQIFDKGISLFTGQALAHNYIDEIMALIRDGKLRADDIITHRLPLDEAPHGFKIFNEKEDNCVKIVLKP